jgi:hypothetical protein
MHVEDTHGTNSRRNLRESFCAYCEVVPEQYRTKSSQPCDMTLFAQQNRVFFTTSPSLLITISPCFEGECIHDGFVVCDDEDLFFFWILVMVGMEFWFSHLVQYIEYCTYV